MDEHAIADFKQFITAAISQQTSDLSGRLDTIEAAMATKDDIARVDVKIDSKANEILSAIGDTLATNTEAADAAITDLRRQVSTLKAKTA